MENYKIRPYARLLSMLGDQLIKNETIALTELVKNAYDADASTCLINFIDMNADGTAQQSSRIEISDDGYGMSKEILTGHFLNPATPIKKDGKLLCQSKKGRVRQGEKGIGRFSMFKLGKCVTVYSKEDGYDIIHSIKFDFGDYGDEFLDSANDNGGLFLDQLDVEYQSFSMSDLDEDSFIRKNNHGTIIVIEELKGRWGKDKISDLTNEMIRLSPFEMGMINSEEITNCSEFVTDIFVNGVRRDYFEVALQKLVDVINDSTLYDIKGHYSEKGRYIKLDYSEAGCTTKSVSFDLTGMNNDRDSVAFISPRYNKKIVKKYFGNGETTECGDFDFVFYIFDFDAKGMDPCALSQEQKDLISNHRVYLYRDNVRVQPYGSANDDWLSIDQTRSAVKVGEMFSNKQIIGQIKITKEGNPKLIDKTSREGLMEDTPAYSQLTEIIKTILVYVRVNLYQRYKEEHKQRAESKQAKILNQNLKENFDVIRFECRNNKSVLKIINETERATKKRADVYEKRLNTLEQLAGVGMSVEMASHDIMLAINRMDEIIKCIQKNVNAGQNCDLIQINDFSDMAAKNCSFIKKRMTGIQQLFGSSKQRPTDIDVGMVIKQVEDLYSSAYQSCGINVIYEYVGEPVMFHTVKSVLLQVFINLFDNSLYWLDLVRGERKVEICLDGIRQSVIFSDNGPGVSEEDAPYIFDAFYSCKGDEGRGLGLYTAKCLLSHYGYEIFLGKNKIESSGASFCIKPARKGKEDN